MSELTSHYRMLLGLDAAWRVEQVQFSITDKQVEIHLTHSGGQLTCPECVKPCAQADLAPQRTWRHLDTIQLQAVIHARLPRANREPSGVKTTLARWASRHSRSTLLF